ncbi:unnamed protein product [Caenorhabditis angaria]|uniref:Neurotransmitter-gated ion-channel ligand-binding domain-containing protein n=1 Tax=Caenorhabditis angaria TaxID=860376 RepID=A0A9P1IX90_9PELO|nr:unnamed protein product [Caenorhabditis angaria]
MDGGWNALGNIIQLSSLFVLGPSEELMKTSYDAETKLYKDLFTGLDEKPFNDRYEVHPMLFISHVSAIDEEQQIVQLHGSFKINWIDPRLKWDPENYDKIKVITHPISYFYQNRYNFTYPKINVNHIHYDKDLMGYYNEIGIKYDGTVTMTTFMHIKTTCFFTFGLYPNDYQNCSFQLYTEKYGNKLRFSSAGVIKFGNQRYEETPHMNDFKLERAEGRGGYLFNGKWMQKVDESQERFAIPIFNYNFVFKRVKNLYFVEMALPMICQTVFLGISGIAKGFHGLFWLMICLVYEIYSMTELFESLPPDYNSMPLIGTLGIFLLIETVALMFWRTFTINIRSWDYKNLEVCEDGTVLNPFMELADIGDGIISVLLIIQMIMNVLVLI